MDLERTLQLFYETTQIPMELFENEICTLLVPSDNFSPSPLKYLCQYLLDSQQPVCYGISDNFLVCGIIRNEHKSSYLLVGPVPLFTFDEE